MSFNFVLSSFESLSDKNIVLPIISTPPLLLCTLLFTYGLPSKLSAIGFSVFTL